MSGGGGFGLGEIRYFLVVQVRGIEAKSYVGPKVSGGVLVLDFLLGGQFRFCIGQGLWVSDNARL